MLASLYYGFAHLTLSLALSPRRSHEVRVGVINHMLAHYSRLARVEDEASATGRRPSVARAASPGAPVRQPTARAAPPSTPLAPGVCPTCRGTGYLPVPTRVPAAGAAAAAAGPSTGAPAMCWSMECKLRLLTKLQVVEHLLDAAEAIEMSGKSRGSGGRLLGQRSCPVHGRS